MTETRESIENEVALIIDEKIMEGGSENGRLDEAEALDKAHDILDAVLDWASEKIREDITEAMQKDDLKLITGEEMNDFRDFIEKASDTIENSIDADTWLENLEL